MSSWTREAVFVNALAEASIEFCVVGEGTRSRAFAARRIHYTSPGATGGGPGNLFSMTECVQLPEDRLDVASGAARLIVEPPTIRGCADSG